MLSHLKPLPQSEALETLVAASPHQVRHSSSVSVILPTLDEVENIDRAIGEIIDNLETGYTFEILVADGGSRDGTCERVGRWGAHYPVRLLQNNGGGLAEDVLAAAGQAQYSIVVVIDADGSHPAGSLAELIDRVASGRHDMAIGSRYVDGGATVGWSLRRRLLSRLGAAFASPFTDVRDPLSGFFAIRRPCLLAAGTHARGFKIGLAALLAAGAGFRVCEVPISFVDRQSGQSKIGAGHLVAYLAQLLAYLRGTRFSGTFPRFSVVGTAGFVLDLVIASFVQGLGAGIMVAHICGFSIATACSYVGHAHYSFDDRGKDSVQRMRSAAVWILALAMRGGIISAASLLCLPVTIALAAGIIGGGIVSYLGNDLFAFRRKDMLPLAVRWKLGAIGLTTYVFFLRLFYQGAIDLMPQEAYYWTYAQHLDWGYLDHPPMVAWLIWLGTAVFSDSEFGVRIAAPLCWLATAFFMFRSTSETFGRTAAFLSLPLLAVLPFFFATGAVMTPDAPLTAAWAGALYFLQRALVAGCPKAWLGAGVLIGFGMLSKYTIALLGPAALVFMIVRPQSRRWFATRWPYLCAICATALFSPVVAWNAAHGWLSFEFQGSRRWLSDDVVFSAPTLLLFIAIVLGPVGLLLAATSTARLTRLLAARRLCRSETFLAVFTFVPLAVFIAFSQFHAVKLNWTGPIWLALLPLMARMIETALRSASMTKVATAAQVLAIGTVLVFSVLLHYLALGLPLVGYPKGLRAIPIAFEEFVSAAEEVKARVAATTDGRPLLVGMDKYNVASELGFYGRGRTRLDDITSRNLFGDSGLMFEHWRSAQALSGRVVIMVGLKEDSLSGQGLANWFEEIGPIEQRTIYKGGTEAGRFFYRIGYGYRTHDGGRV
jgi:dolichol-phosphate mannosyltransferase